MRLCRPLLLSYYFVGWGTLSAWPYSITAPQDATSAIKLLHTVRIRVLILGGASGLKYTTVDCLQKDVHIITDKSCSTIGILKHTRATHYRSTKPMSYITRYLMTSTSTRKRNPKVAERPAPTSNQRSTEAYSAMQGN
jgi:hypothetical protein